MKNKIKLKDKDVDYILRKSRRAKRMRLAVYCDGSFVVTLPRGFSVARAEEFIKRQAEWVLEKIGIMSKIGAGSIFSKVSRREYLKLKQDAFVLAETKVQKLNEFYRLKYNKISIRNQKTRWGSCSRKGNLNFNYKIVLLPEKYAEYIVAHELCHLQEFNHSRKFWDLVAKTIPDYKQRIREMRSL